MNNEIYNTLLGVTYTGHNEAAKQKISNILNDVDYFKGYINATSATIRKPSAIIDCDYYYDVKSKVMFRERLKVVVEDLLSKLERLTINPVNYS